MAFLDWDDSYSVGHIEIDIQHRKLVNLINLLHDRMKEGKGKDASVGILKDLLEYADYHFKTEEDLMVKAEFPDLEKHREEHRSFEMKVHSMAMDAEKGEYLISLELNEFLKNWLTSHIKGSDKQYAPYLNEIGL